MCTSALVLPRVYVGPYQTQPKAEALICPRGSSAASCDCIVVLLLFRTSVCSSVHPLQNVWEHLLLLGSPAQSVDINDNTWNKVVEHDEKCFIAVTSRKLTVQAKAGDWFGSDGRYDQ